MIQAFNKAFSKANCLTRSFSQPYFLPFSNGYYQRKFSVISLQNSASKPKGNASTYELEPNTHDFSSPKRENKSLISQDSNLVTKVKLSKTLSVKDLDWISSKLKGTEEQKTKKPASKGSKKSTKPEDVKTQSPVDEPPLEGSLKVDSSYEQFKAKWSRLDKKSEADDIIKIKEPVPIEPWRLRKQQMKEKFKGRPWEPARRLSRTAMDRIRFLAAEMPDEYSLPKIAEEFNIPYEAVRRIIKSKFQPTPEITERQEEKRKQKRIEFLRSRENFILDPLAAKTSPPNFPPSKKGAPKNIADATLLPSSFEPEYEPQDVIAQKKPLKSKWTPEGEHEGWDKL